MLVALKKYAVFSGRARRSEYWLFFLFYLIVIFVTGFIDGILGTFDERSGYGILSGLSTAVLIIPLIAVLVRRLHDLDKSGWWALIIIVPIAGFVLLIFACMDGTHGANRFGPDPKASERISEN